MSTVLRNSEHMNKLKKTTKIEKLESETLSYSETYVVESGISPSEDLGIVAEEPDDDYSFISYIPDTSEDKESSYLRSSGTSVKYEYFYNYQARAYELGMNNNSELMIPNIYATINNGTNLRKDLPLQSTFFENKKISKDLFLLSSYRMTKVAGATPQEARYRRIILANNVLNSPEAKSQKMKYPYGIQIRYSSRPSGNKFRRFLENQNMFVDFVNHYSHLDLTAMSFTINYDSYSFSTGESSRSFPRVDLDALLSDPSFSLGTQRDTNTFVFGKEPSRYNPFTGLSKLISLKAFYINLLKEEHRDYKRVLSGAKCYSEVIFYKIEKFLGDRRRNPIQTYYIPNIGDNFDFIDTQVKTGTIYNYAITEGRLVVGNSIDSTTRPKKDKTEIKVNNTPVASIIEIPLHVETKATALPPPPAPQMTFSVKQDSRETVHIQLKPTVGTYRRAIQSIEEQEMEHVEMLNTMLRGSEKMPEYEYYGGKIGYELYRVDEPPESLRDFQLNYRYDFDNVGLERNLKFQDPVEKNKKYYYLARAYNENGLKSFPSTIYEVELLQSGADSKIICSEYHFPNLDPHTRTINMKSLLQIVPAGQQTLIESQNRLQAKYRKSYKNSLDDVSLGTVKDKVWGRNFKIRLTSRDTGRKIDFNVKFDIKKKKSNQELK